MVAHIKTRIYHKPPQLNLPTLQCIPTPMQVEVWLADEVKK